MPTTPHDVIIIGSGAAGLTAAINLAQDRKVLVLAKGALDSGSTNWAQGGIAAVLDAGDSFEAHVDDTMVAGAGLNNRATVEFVVSEAPAAIERLAASELRSANAQIEMLLREALADRGIALAPGKPPRRGRPKKDD